jgi:hypothetical protein
MAKLTHEISLAKIEMMAHVHPHNRVVYSVGTCWWKIGDPIYQVPAGRPGEGLPCDPRGAVLMETDDLAGFLQAAKENPEHYGKHGLDAFMAAYHGNVVATNGYPTCFKTWQEYNDLIDVENLKSQPETAT